MAFENILENMAQLHEWKTNMGITDEDSWNMDETGFRIGVRKSQFVVSTHKVKKLVMADPDNGDYITSVERINGKGRVIPPMIILQKKLIFDKWAVSRVLVKKVRKVRNDGLSVFRSFLANIYVLGRYTRRTTKS